MRQIRMSSFVWALGPVVLVLSGCGVEPASGDGTETPAASSTGGLQATPEASNQLATQLSNRPPVDRFDGVKGVVHRLRMKQGSQVAIPGFSLTVTEDGRRLLRGSGTLGPQDGPMSIRFQVDPQTLEYSAQKVEASVAEGITGEADRSLTLRGKGAAGDGLVGVARQNYPYRRTVSVATLDPALITLTKTTARLWWNTDFLGVYDVSARWQCWNAYPSELGTHWFRDHCGTPAFDNRPNDFCISTGGQYSNWDFGSDEESTHVRQDVYLCAYGGGFATYDWGHLDEGEGSSLIFGQFNVLHE
jgi:hypothetical protein